MNLLHRYLFRELLGATLAGVALFAFILLTGNAIKDLFALVADGKLTVQATAEMLVMLFPFVLTYAMPMGLLTAVLLTLGRFSAQHEITAMRAAGVGLARIGAPVLLIAVVSVAISLVVNFSYAPNAKSAYRERLAAAARTNPLSFIVERTFVRQFPGVVLYAGAREGNRLRDFWVWELDKQNRVTRFSRADSGYFEWNEEDNYVMLVLENGRVELRNTDDPEDFSKVPISPSFERLPIQLPLDRVFKRQQFVKKVSWMNFSELVSEQRRLQTSTDPADAERLLQVKMNIHEKAALAFSVLSFALIGVPLGIRTRRSETSANLGVALALTMGYYLIMIAAGWLDKRPELHPELLVWLPNFLFQTIGLWCWRRLGRN
ncbi:MAG: LptF/LptG family permease [Opitutaceae bacterium]